MSRCGACARFPAGLTVVVTEQAVTRAEGEQVRHCLDNLTDRQREALKLSPTTAATPHPEVATLLNASLSAIKTRFATDSSGCATV